MEVILLTIILLVGLAILYFQIKAKLKKEENVTDPEEEATIVNLNKDKS